MSSISIIGSGTWPAPSERWQSRAAIPVVVSRDAAKSAALVKTLGGGATAGTFGTTPAGDIVILAVLADSAFPVVREFGDALAGQIIVDFSTLQRHRHRAGGVGSFNFSLGTNILG